MDIFGISKGMTVAEIGAGRGRYVVHLADRVGVNGKVYAEDISKKSLDYLENRCKEGGLKNDAAGDGERCASCRQVLAGHVNGGERRRAHRIERHARPM